MLPEETLPPYGVAWECEPGVDTVICATVKSYHVEPKEDVKISKGTMGRLFEMLKEASSKARITYGLFICMSRGLMDIMMYPENCVYFLEKN